MGEGTQRGFRFSSWDGTQDPLDADTGELFDRLAEDVFHGWDFDSALRRLLGQGWRDQRGRRHQGVEALMEQLRRRRQQQLERFNVDGVFADIQERLDGVLRQERQGISERIASAADESAQRVLDRVAARRRETLDNLPPEPGGAIRELQKYEFMDQRAEQQFTTLLDELKKGITETYFKDITQSMRAMSPADMAHLRSMLKDLNALVARHLEGAPPDQVQQQYQRFLGAWGGMFPDAPPTFLEFIEQLQHRMAQLDSLMQSLSPEMRVQFDELMEGVFGDPELQDLLGQLSGAMELMSPSGRLGQRYQFFGGEQLPLDQAMELMGSLQSMEQLENALRDVYRGGEIDPATREHVREQLGDAAADSLDHLQQAARTLTEQGLVERDPEGLRLTARGMRRIGQKALVDLFTKLKRDSFGSHQLHREGAAGERADDTKPYVFGDAFDLDIQRTLMNAVQREAGDAEGSQVLRGSGRLPHLDPEDFEVHRTDTNTRSATVLMLDMSRSMPLRGYFYAAKKVAMALDSLIRTQFPRDSLHIIGFSDYAREISPAALPQLSVNEYVYGTNLQHGLIMARRLLARDRGANKQIIVISDGEPTAHMEGSHAVFFYPPLPETLHKTLLEVQRCTREHITINTFMLESNHQLVSFVNRMTKLNHGRAFFISPDRLGDYVLVDYARQRGRAA